MTYSWILLDADDTLFDFDLCEESALADVFGAYGLPCNSNSIALYREINNKLWRAYEKGMVDQEELKVSRFTQLFEGLAASEEAAAASESKRWTSLDARQFSRDYLDCLATQHALIEGTEEVLAQLHASYKLAIVTNGISHVQRGRVAASPIGKYITDIIISDEAGFPKPDARIFDFAFARLQLERKEEVLMVGDNLFTDIKGAAAYGLDTCWLAPQEAWGRQEGTGISPTYHIASIRELPEVIKKG